MYSDIKYDQLEDPDRWIRLIKLEPSPSESTSEPDRPDLLVCNIEEYIRGDSQPYTALSYVWESPDSPKRLVSVDGTKIDISSTVENALRRLRFRNKPRWLWVDQLCINQADEMEKSHQVHQMHHIYREADQVIAWLGNGDESSDLICRLMRDTGRALRSNNLDALQKLYSGEKEEGSIDIEAAKTAFHAFCERRYWQRLWIMQEFAVGRRIAIACGGWIVKYDLMDQTLDAPSIVQRRAQKKPIDGLERLIRNLNYVYSTPLNSYVYSLFTRRWHYDYTPDGESPRGQPLLQVVAVSLTLEVDYNVVYATDPRDRIFALLNLAGDRDRFNLFPDYSLTVEEVYREAACKILEQGTIDVLMYCQRPRKLVMLPSWVPDWSMDVLHPNAQAPWDTPFKASGTYTAIPKFPEFDTATFEGIHVDKVQEIGTTWDPNWLKPISRTAVKQWVKSIRGFCDNSPRIRVGEERLDAARIGILDGPTWQSTVPYQGWGSQCADDVENLQRFGTEEGEKGEDASSAEDSFYAFALMRMHTRRVFMTSTGFVGVGPLDMQPGDEVCILLGGKVPYLLRPQGNESYTLVGEAYVHGIMHGELFKGGARNLRKFDVK
ncbi:heterokaryon incompatibility protein [Fusarium coicis]|nr:heterokaryon incompatibility protein [Fusarium coicis]